MDAEKIINFCQTIKLFYQKNRREFVWRQTTDPYKILVSEVMLQQTQTTRVVEKYELFLQAFPTVDALAQAPFQEVLLLWKGLGYNRRALSLQRCAQTIVAEHQGVFPSNYNDLIELPGIGPYTASAVCTFAFNRPLVFIETNIRAVFIHEFFQGREKIHDREIMPLIEQTVDKKNPREWYYALMDYGAQLKKRVKNPSRKSAHHAQQSKFEGSSRQVRGLILQALLDAGGLLTVETLSVLIDRPENMIKKALLELIREELVKIVDGFICL
jgi:A/G-specific adenine glycosylase